MMEDFSGLALPPLFGGHILEAELPDEVELGSGEVELGPGGELLDSGEPGPDEEERRELDKRKYLVLSQRCKEIEQVNEKILGRLHQVQRITRRLKKERRYLMKTLDSYGDDYRNAQLTILLEDDVGATLECLPGAEDDRPNGHASSSPSLPQCTAGTKKKRHRIPKEKEKEAQADTDLSMLADSQFTGFPSPNSLSH
ncbi:TCF3 fusion partner [Clupea harengus]|uniref:TCF3 fusion partner n=1 Tax=Clupea harengus TaxID=7950 RepID=A0A6P3VQH1_CLUHA|nr:TCF3 fusion partner [Clupea harengus]XP_031431768.1 TCF3 fusion partner [Clupea harengus]